MEGALQQKVSKMREVPDDVKIFLRSVLVTTPGMPQSMVAKEYHETTDERIEYMKYGYRNIYEFLISLQGDVTRLEFSPKHGDNLVFAVLDKTKYASKHAQKYASKSNSGMAPKSPEEILEWKKAHLERGTLPMMTKKKSSGKGGKRGGTRQWNNTKGSFSTSNRPNRRVSQHMVPRPLVSENKAPVRRLSPAPSVTAETSASTDEWALLGQLLPERDNKFTLLVREIGVSQLGRLKPVELFSHFAAYNIHKEVTYRYEYAHKDVTNRQEWACISFPTHFTAYRAWKEKHNSIMYGCRIGVQPAGGSLSSLTNPLFKVMVVDLPKNIIMSKLVTKFVRFSALVCVNARPRESCAIIVYSKKESAQRACTEVTNIKVDDVMITLNVQPLLEDAADETHFSDPAAEQKLTKLSYCPAISPEKERTVCIDFLRNNCFRGSRCIYSHNIEKHSSQKTCSLPQRVSKDHQQGLCDRTDPSETTKSSNEKNNNNNNNSKIIEELLSLEGRICRFCISYQQWFQMFQITRRKQPKVIYHYPEDIQFLVTYQPEPIRFWAWVMMDGVEKSAQKLGAIEKNIAEMVSKVQPPTNLPKAGHRGAALFKDDTNETWYRCYVLSSDAEKDQIEVFYCDYGNSEWVKRDLFRSTYNDAWTLDPLAVPMKLSGVELKEGVDLSSYYKLTITDVLQGHVVRSSHYSEPHILELKNITCSSNGVCVDKEMISTWCVSTEESTQKPATEEEEKHADEKQSLVEEVVEGPTECNGVENDERKPLAQNGKACEVASSVGNHELEEDDSAEEEEAAENSEEDFEEEKPFGVVSSLFDYDQEDLVDGVICQAHHPNLIYLRLGDTSSFDLMQLALDSMELILPNLIEKDDIMMLCREVDRRRVQVVQVLPSFRKAKVLHVDHGTIEWIDTDNLYLLPQDMQDALFQARPASLAGVDCTAKMENAVAFVQSKSNLKVKVNVLTESDDGKVSVELFDVTKCMSINKAMVDLGVGLYSRKNYKACEVFTPSLVATPVEVLEKCRTEDGVLPGSVGPNQEQRTSSAISWHSNAAMSCSEVSADDVGWGSLGDEDDGEEDVGSGDDVFEDLSAISALTCSALNAENTSVGVTASNHHRSRAAEESFDYFYQELLHNENNGVSYPPPDIVESANGPSQLNSSPKNLMSSSIQIEGQLIDFDLSKPVVDVNKRNKMLALWVVQKKKMMEVEKRLSRLLAMNDEDLRKHYAEMRRLKLLQAVSVNMARKHSLKLEQDNEKVIKKTNQMLALV